MALAFAPYGKEMIITKILTDNNTKRHLENLGLCIGGGVTSIFDNSGDVVIKVKNGRLAINKSLAMKILVS